MEDKTDEEEGLKVAVFKCEKCGFEKDTRCKPKKCEKCGAVESFSKKA